MDAEADAKINTSVINISTSSSTTTISSGHSGKSSTSIKSSISIKTATQIQCDSSKKPATSKKSAISCQQFERGIIDLKTFARANLGSEFVEEEKMI